MLKKYRNLKATAFLLQFLGNQRGSLVGVLMATGILGVGITGLITYFQHFHKTTTQTAEQINFNPQFLGAVLGNMKSLLMDAQKNTNHISNHGICALVKSDSVKLKKGVEAISLDITKLNGTPNPLDWNKFFPGPPPNGEWKKVLPADTVAIGKCQEVERTFTATSNLMKCFDYTGDRERANKIYVVAQILPKEFPSSADATSNNNLDAGKSIFHLKASLGVIPLEDDSGSTGKIAYINTRSDILWANDAGSCVITESCTVDADCSQVGATCVTSVCSPQSPKIVRLSVSNMVGTADEGILNAQLELGNADASCGDGLTIGELKPYATQGGKLETGTNWSVKDENSPVYMACVMKKFRCKSHTITSIDTFFDEGMHFTFQMDNDTGRSVTITKMNPTLQGPGASDYPAFAVYSLAPDHPFEVIQGGAADGKFRKIGSTIYPDPPFKDDPGDKLILNIPPGGGQFKVMMRGNEDCVNPGDHCTVFKVCDGVCQSSQNWYPQVQITIDDPKLGTCSLPVKSYSANNIECISCFAKSCHRMGQGTVGKRADIPDEALDSQLPECRAAGAGADHTNSRKIASSNTFQNNTNQNTANNSGGCIALNLGGNPSNIDGEFKSKTFEQKSCTTSYPVLCFANGRYQPATKWNSSTQAYVLNEVVYDQAQRACYEMGKEVIDKNRLRKYMKDTGGTGDYNSDICSGSNCEFVNNATRGMFFLPTYDIGTVHNKNLLTGKNFIWVAAELDRGGLVVAAPLKADIATGSTDKYALFNNKDSSENYEPVLLEETAPSAGGTSDPYVLVYSVRYKGLIKRPKATSLKFVCQKSSDATFFLTSAAHTFCNGSTLNGPEKCANEDGFFVPPESALDYSRAMMLLKNTNIEDETTDEYAIPVDTLGTATNYVHNTGAVADTVQAWVAVKDNPITCP